MPALQSEPDLTRGELVPQTEFERRAPNGSLELFAVRPTFAWAPHQAKSQFLLLNRIGMADRQVGIRRCAVHYSPVAIPIRLWNWHSLGRFGARPRTSFLVGVRELAIIAEMDKSYWIAGSEG